MSNANPNVSVPMALGFAALIASLRHHAGLYDATTIERSIGSKPVVGDAPVCA